MEDQMAQPRLRWPGMVLVPIGNWDESSRVVLVHAMLLVMAPDDTVSWVDRSFESGDSGECRRTCLQFLTVLKHLRVRAIFFRRLTGDTTRSDSGEGPEYDRWVLWMGADAADDGRLVQRKIETAL
jgi:hypothetical protein